MKYSYRLFIISLLVHAIYSEPPEVVDIDTDISTTEDTSALDVSITDTVNLGAKSILYKKGVGLFKEGLNAYMNKDYEEAYETFEKVLKLDPLHEESFMLLHRAKNKLGIVEIEREEAKDTSRSPEQIQQDLFKLGLTEFTNSDFTKAKRTWNRLNNINPKFSHLKSYLRKVDKEISRMRKDKHARSRIDLLFKSGSDGYVNGNIIAARTSLDSVLFFDPNHKEALSLLLKINEDILKKQAVQFRKGIMQYSQGDYLKAIAIWKKALVIDSTNSILNSYISEAQNQLQEIRKMHLTEGKRHLAEDKLKRSIDEYDQIIRYFPEDQETRNELSAINERYQKEVKDKYNDAVELFNRNEYEKAALLFENIIHIDPSFVAAKEYLQKCRKNITAIAEARKISGLKKEAELLQQKGDWESAVRKWHELIDIDSLNTSAHDNIAKCKAKIDTQRNSLELQKTFNRSVSLYQNGKITEAKSLWNRILADDPDNEMVKQMLQKINTETTRQLSRGNSFTKKEQWSQAIAAYKKVLSMDPGNAAAKQALAQAKRKKAQVKKTAAAPKKVDQKAIEKLFNAGLDLYMAKKYKPALAEFSKIVALDPANTRAKSYIKNLKSKLDRLKNL